MEAVEERSRRVSDWAQQYYAAHRAELPRRQQISNDQLGEDGEWALVGENVVIARIEAHMMTAPEHAEVSALAAEGFFTAWIREQISVYAPAIAA